MVPEVQTPSQCPDMGHPQRCGLTTSCEQSTFVRYHRKSAPILAAIMIQKSQGIAMSVGGAAESTWKHLVLWQRGDCTRICATKYQKRTVINDSCAWSDKFVSRGLVCAVVSVVVVVVDISAQDVDAAP
jgi:hypothetical protein